MVTRVDDPEQIALRDVIFEGAMDPQCQDVFSVVDDERLHAFHGYLREYALTCGIAENYSEAKRPRDIWVKAQWELTARVTQPDNIGHLSQIFTNHRSLFDWYWNERAKQQNDSYSADCSRMTE
jgi:hypothetical protein